MSDQPKPLTDEEIAELTRLEAEATPEPWIWSNTRQRVECDSENVLQSSLHYELDTATCDLNLLIAARNALPRLLAERVADKKEIDRLQAGLQKTKDDVYVVPGMTLWYRSPAGIIETPTLDSWAEIEDTLGEDEDVGPVAFYSTRETTEKATQSEEEV